MTPPPDGPHVLSRRRFLHATAASVLTAATAAAPWTPARAAVAGAARGPAPAAAPATQTSDPDFRRLDDVIHEAMERYGVPGVAVGVLHAGRAYTNGYGVTNLNAPLPVDASTLFQTGSITKTYTATLMMRLVDMGRVALDAPVRRYLPDLTLADDAVAAAVTVRQLLNHTAGWFGDYFGPEPSALQPAVWPNRGDDAVAAYVADMASLPQLAPLGAMFSYNNAALVLAGRVIEVVTGQTYEAALTELLLKPLGMGRAFLFPEEAISYRVAAGHGADADGTAVVNPLWAMPRAMNPAGGLILPITEQLTYARFHLGDGTAADGTRLLSPAALAEMRTPLAPGAAISVTANAEVYGVGVGWMLEQIDGVQIVTHSGATFGQMAVLALVPERGFAVAVFANTYPQGDRLNQDVSTWALEEYLGLSTPLPATVDLPAAWLAEYVGRYGVEVDVPGGHHGAEVVEVSADGGGLTVQVFEGSSLQEPLDQFTPAGPAARLAFFRADAALVTEGDHTSLGADFVRDASGRIGWLRWGARIQPRLS
jgi:CubicO group peptidase (beta-lactamase class C family)